MIATFVSGLGAFILGAMSHRPRRSLARVTGAGALLALATVLGVASESVLAECDGPYPDFRRLTRTAERIVIGDVVELHPGGAWDPLEAGIASRFTFQVRHVVRGESQAVVEIKDLPTQPCAGVVGVRLGDRIALAIGGLDFEPPMRVNMVAWIESVPPEGFGPGSISQAATLSVAEVYALVGLNPPAEEGLPSPAATVPDSGDTSAAGLPVIPLAIVATVLSLLGLLAIWRLRAARPEA
jgi:hypothetical protein